MTRSMTLAAAAAILIAGAAGYVFTQSGAGTTPLPPLAVSAQESDAAGGEAPEIAEMTIGKADAPVEVIEYASFTCPHCREFHETVFPQFKKDYIDTGKVRLTYREVYFDRPGLWASMVARCGGEMRFFGIVKLLYDKQTDWVRGEPAQIADNLRKIGRTAGLSKDQLDSCLTDAAKAQALVSYYETNAEKDGIEATPSFVINGETHRNMAYEDLKKILDSEVEAEG